MDGKTYLTPMLWFAAITVVSLALTRIPFSWEWLPPEPCRLSNCYCEPFRSGSFVLQPITALSNLGYVLVGLLALGPRRRFQSANAAAEKGSFSSWFGTGLILAGLFSFFSHASLSRLGEWLDLMGVYLLGGLLAVHGLGRLADISPGRQAALLVSALLIGGLQMALAPEYQLLGIVIFFGSALALETAVQIGRRPRGDRGLLLAALACYSAGGVIWATVQGDCAAVFPGHAGWHLLSAAAAGLVILYDRTEKGTEPGGLN